MSVRVRVYYQYMDTIASLRTSSRPERVRLLRAELEVLERFDTLRSRAGHDYGAGQRAAELVRRRRELESADLHATLSYPSASREVLAPESSRDELAVAFARVGVPRIERIRGEVYRRETPASRRTLDTWRRLERQYTPTPQASA